MPPNGSYPEGEMGTLARRVALDEEPRCPRCEGLLVVRSLPPLGEAAYVRNRISVLCPGCARSGVLDRRAVKRIRRRSDGD